MFIAIGKEMIDAEATEASSFYGLDEDDLTVIKSLDPSEVDEYIRRNVGDDFYEVLDRLKSDVINNIISDKIFR